MRPGRAPTIAVRTAACLVLVGLAVPAFAAGETAAPVTYVTGLSVYVGAGAEEGLAEGALLELTRDGEPVATCRVADVSTHRASCTILDRTVDPLVGDLATLTSPPPPRDPEEGTVPFSAEEKGTAPSSGWRRAIRGRIGVRYLTVVDRTDSNSEYAQPGLDLRVDARALGGSAWGFDVDARARRTSRTYSDGRTANDSRTRVYRAAARRVGTDDPWSLTVGRQFASELAAVSIFDGVTASYVLPHVSFGLFSGTQPDATDFGYSDSIREHGVYAGFTGEPSPGRRWHLTTGVIGSYEDSEINREFLYLQGRYAGPRLSAYVTQEVDYNRDWKSDVGESTIDPTSTFASLWFRVTRDVRLNAGYDNRRNVRLWRDRETPETEFDDEFRRGIWGGASVDLFERLQVGVDYRTNGGGTAGDSDAYGLTIGLRRLGPWNVNVRGRGTRYTNDRVEGLLVSLSTGVNVGKLVYVQLGGGRRDEDNLTSIPANNVLTWYALDVDVNLGRRWYLLLSLERSDGDLEEVDQLMTGVSYRF